MSGSSGNVLDAISHPGIIAPNYLQDVGGAQQVAAGIWQNRQNQANQLAGQAYLGSINPDGTPNQTKLLQNLQAAGPAVALAAQPSSQAGQTLSADQQQQQYARLAYGASGASQLLAKYPGGPPREAVQQFWDQAVADGHVTPADEAGAMAAFGSDPAANRQVILQRLSGNIAAQTAMTNQAGQYTGVTTGPTYQGMNIAGPGANTPYAPTPVGAPVPVGLPTKADLTTLIPGPPGPHGEPTTTTKGAILAGNGLNEQGNPIANRAFAGLPGGLRNPNAPPPAPTPVVTGNAPGTEQAAASTAVASGGAYDQIRQESVRARTQRAALQSMAADATQFTPGPGQDKIKGAQAILQRIAPQLASMFGVDPNKLAANEDLDKVAAQLSDAQNIGSDARLAVNQGANPSSHNTPAGLALILAKLTGNADYAAARGQLAEQYQQSKDPRRQNNTQFESDVGAQLDPRVFQYNRMTPAQQNDYFTKELTTTKARDGFKKAYLQAKGLQVLPND